MGIFMYKVYEPYLFTIAIAILLVMGSLGAYETLMLKTKKSIYAASTLTFFVTLCFFFPLFYFIGQLTKSLSRLNREKLTQIVDSVKQWMLHKLDTFGIDIEEYLDYINPSELVTQIIDASGYLGQIGVNFILDIFMILVFYFFILLYLDKFTFYLQGLIPMNNKEQQKVTSSLASTMSIVFVSTLVTAILEGFLFFIIMQTYGYNGVLFGVIYGFASLLPVIGGLIVVVPIALYELSLGGTTNAIVIAVYSFVVIYVIADTIVKPIIIRYIREKKKDSLDYQIHEMIIFFAILAGVTAFGFWGMIIGPAITAIFLTLLYIYATQKSQKETE